MKPKQKDGKIKRNAENFHFWVPQDLADKFKAEAKADDRPISSLFRNILRERYMDE